MAKEKRRAKTRRPRKKQLKQNLFTPYNYKFLVLGIVLIVAGFTMMYLENKQFGFIALYVTPLMVTAGYITVAVGVFKTDPSLMKELEESKEKKEQGVS
ncbi:hypothetical protein QLX67_02735 [Balneolaceae bacterium ANBcel3]|nr:hypothetical protein [Balneolaceae bacterium ANBcel3]